jgi:hypothetical protein
MSFWDDLERGVHALYDTTEQFTAGVVDFLPPYLQVDGVPVPTVAALTFAFGSGGSAALRAKYWTAFGINYAHSSNGVPAVENLLRLGNNGMTALVIANVYRVTIQGHSGSRAVDNVIGVRGTTSGQEVAAANAVKAAWEASGGPAGTRPPQYNVLGYYAVDLSSSTGGIATLTSTKVGGTGTTVATNAASALVKWNGSNRSRSTRGRLYLGPLGESEIGTDGQTLASSFQTSIAAAMNQFKTALNTAGFPLCVISVKGNFATDVTALSVEGQIATQRRRIRV